MVMRRDSSGVSLLLPSASPMIDFDEHFTFEREVEAVAAPVVFADFLIVDDFVSFACTGVVRFAETLITFL